MTIQKKRCARCCALLPLESFQRRKSARHGRGSYCYPCAREMSMETYARIRADEKRRRHRDEYLRDYRRATHLARFYGMTVDEFDQRVESQDGICVICQRLPSGSGPAGRLAVDHCHDCGGIRGLVCTQCNTLMGMAADDVDRLLAAIAYLMAHEHADVEVVAR